MKKILITLILPLFITCSPALAQSVKVTALQDFSSENPTQTLKVITLEKTEFKNGLILEEGTVILGDVVDVKHAKRGKINASFKFAPTSYTHDGKTVKVTNNEYIAKYAPYKELDKTEVAASAVSTVGGIFVKVPGFGQAVSFAKGVIKDPEHDRLKSGVTQIYKDSPLAYVEEGKEINIAKDELFILKFKTKKEAEEEAAQESEQPHEAQDIQAPLEPAKAAPVPVTNIENKTPPLTIQPVNPEEILKEVEAKTKAK